LRVAGYDNVFTVGDIAASDPHRSSARNWGFRLLGHNIRAYLEDREADLQRYEPPAYRWGSVFGVQSNGLRVFQPDGGSFRFPSWTIRTLLFPLAVREMIYKGVRKPDEVPEESRGASTSANISPWSASRRPQNMARDLPETNPNQAALCRRGQNTLPLAA
jgi:hypothetical protein